MFFSHLKMSPGAFRCGSTADGKVSGRPAKVVGCVSTLRFQLVHRHAAIVNSLDVLAFDLRLKQDVERRSSAIRLDERH